MRGGVVSAAAPHVAQRPPPVTNPAPSASSWTMLRPSRPLLFAGLLAGTLAAGTCSSESLGPGDTLAEGTWGGDDVALMVGDTAVHVHFGCTYGDFPAPVDVDEDGRFSVSGEYVLDAYPVAVGPPLPAELAGVVRGNRLTMTVAVNDTTAGRLVVLGPDTVRLGEDAEMRMCPICEMPD